MCKYIRKYEERGKPTMGKKKKRHKKKQKERGTSMKFLKGICFIEGHGFKAVDE